MIRFSKLFFGFTVFVLLLWLLGLYVVSAALSFAQHFIMTGL